MKKIIVFLALFVLSSCTQYNDEFEIEYNRLAAHINVIDQTSSYVIYEYSDVRIDEIAPIAELYCRDHGGKTSKLYKISLSPDNRRRATFSCF